MYSKQLAPKVGGMFTELERQASEVTAEAESLKEAGREITEATALKTAGSSRAMLADLYAQLSKQALSSPEFQTDQSKNRFYEADLRREIFENYRFSCEKTVCFTQTKATLPSLAVAAGAAIAGGILIVALSPEKLLVPVALAAAASAAAFAVSYFLVVPMVNQKRFAKAVDEFLERTEKDYLAKFDEAERYFNRRVIEIAQSL